MFHEVHLKVHTQRRKHLKESEFKYWEDVPIEAMSSEEESADGNIYRRKPSWRSNGIAICINNNQHIFIYNKLYSS